MKLYDLLKEIDVEADLFTSAHDIFKMILATRKDELLQCEEFSECGEDFEAVSNPKDTYVYKVPDNFKIPKGAKIYSIQKSPYVFDFNKSLTQTPYITPTLFIPQHEFTPFKFIVLGFSPETFADNQALGLETEEDLRIKLHLQLDQILNNPDKFIPEPRFHVMVRMSVGEQHNPTPKYDAIP